MAQNYKIETCRDSKLFENWGEYEIEFDIKLTSRIYAWRNLFRVNFGPKKDDFTGPALWMGNKGFYFWQKARGKDVLFKSRIYRVKEWIHVKLVHKQLDDKKAFWKVTIDGPEKDEYYHPYSGKVVKVEKALFFMAEPKSWNIGSLGGYAEVKNLKITNLANM